MELLQSKKGTCMYLLMCCKRPVLKTTTWSSGKGHCSWQLLSFAKRSKAGLLSTSAWRDTCSCKFQEFCEQNVLKDA